ncbi:MAG: hypothetical protein Q8P68_04965 [Candidatus Peregrinibacteria bacterium]|nr:hypothetical protein [Candidatus Peregrinibacteria bacterium]MDZ4244411.1 hypothetical protein [Candidatus Gracilibacteria bacterium]
MPSIVSRLIWGKDLAERREKLERTSIPTGGSKKAKKQRADLGDETAEVQELSRRTAIVRVGIATVLTAGGGVALLISNEEGPVKSATEVAPIKELVLGNVRFYFEKGSGFSSYEKEETFNGIRSAYNRYVNYFGEETMRFPREIDCPIEKDPSLTQNGFVPWKVIGSPTLSGDMVAEETPILERLVLNDHSEGVIIHEFTHIFLQPEGAQSKSFHEGHAYVIQRLLGYVTSQDENIALLKENPKLSALFDLGLDYSFVDEGYNGGILDVDLQILTQCKFTVEWERLLAMDPDFIKNYYRFISEKRTNGTIGFTKTEMIEIARQASPYFDEWERSTFAVKELGAKSKQVASAVVIPGKGLIILNFHTKPRIIDGDKMWPPNIAYIPGEIVVKITPKNGNIISHTITSPGLHINKISFPDETLKGAEIVVTIGGYEVPVIT